MSKFDPKQATLKFLEEAYKTTTESLSQAAAAASDINKRMDSLKEQASDLRSFIEKVRAIGLPPEEIEEENVCTNLAAEEEVDSQCRVEIDVCPEGDVSPTPDPPSRRQRYR